MVFESTINSSWGRAVLLNHISSRCSCRGIGRLSRSSKLHVGSSLAGAQLRPEASHSGERDVQGWTPRARLEAILLKALFSEGLMVLHFFSGYFGCCLKERRFLLEYQWYLKGARGDPPAHTQPQPTKKKVAQSPHQGNHKISITKKNYSPGPSHHALPR